MNNISIELNEDFLNKLFPFYILINADCEFVSVGKSLVKITQLPLGKKFQDVFEIRRPHTKIYSFDDLMKLNNQLTFFESITESSINLRGQFEYLADKNQMLFVGSPWFYSMDQVREKKLTLYDFAIHDPLIDLLHVLKTAEMASEDLKQLVKTIDKQKKDLKLATKQIEDIALFPTQNPDPLIRINLKGDLLTLNPSAERIENLEYQKQSYDMQSFWQMICLTLNPSEHRTIVEASYNDILYSFVMVLLKEHGYYNIYGRDITSQKNYESELKKMSMVADKTINSVIITDADGLIEWVNEAFEISTGYQLSEIKGLKPGTFLQGPETNPETVIFIRENLKKEISFECEIINYSKAGNPYWIKMKFQPIINDKGKVTQFFAIQDDITEQKHSQEILTRREEKYRSIISNINLGLMEVDLNEKILMVNQSFCDMSGYSQDELVGANTADFFKGKVIDKIIDEKKTLRNNKISDAYELEIINKNNLHKFWLVSGAPMYNDNGEQIGSIGIHLDITDRKDQEKKLEHALKSIQDVNQELNDFAYIVSHDLKAPLRGIGSLATWLEEDYKNKIDKEGQESLHLLVQRTQRMHNLIDGILNYSRVGRTSENIEKVETQNLVVKIIDLISPPSHIHISIDNKLPDVYFDEVKLQQVFQNLLSNAIKFSDKPTGEIIVKSKDDGNFIIFSVTDNGPGIDQNYFEKIFQMFQTLNSRDTFESTGIGLAIVKKIVENYGGKIWLNSKVNEGTTFYFSVKKNNV